MERKVVARAAEAREEEAAEEAEAAGAFSDADAHPTRLCAHIYLFIYLSIYRCMI